MWQLYRMGDQQNCQVNVRDLTCRTFRTLVIWKKDCDLTGEYFMLNLLQEICFPQSFKISQCIPNISKTLEEVFVLWFCLLVFFVTLLVTLVHWSVKDQHICFPGVAFLMPPFLLTLFTSHPRAKLNFLWRYLCATGMRTWLRVARSEKAKNSKNHADPLPFSFRT